jgi:hypothetical protein
MLLAICCALTLVPPAPGTPGAAVWHTDEAKARSLAATTGKPLFIVFR